MIHLMPKIDLDKDWGKFGVKWETKVTKKSGDEGKPVDPGDLGDYEYVEFFDKDFEAMKS